MSHQLMINTQSMRKHSNGNFSAQIIVTDQDDNQSFYACQAYKNGSVDANNIYHFTNGQWYLVKLDSQLVADIKELMNSVIRRTANLYKRTIPSANNEDRYAMFHDAVISVGSASKPHELKIGDRVFFTHDAMSLVSVRNTRQTIDFEMLGAPGIKSQIELIDDPALLSRLQKQYEFAYRLYAKARDSKPIGGMSRASYQNDRKEFGRSNSNHRELQRSRS